jgi:dUTP pyrophosphatase
MSDPIPLFVQVLPEAVARLAQHGVALDLTPGYDHPGDSGLRLFVTEPVTLPPGEPVLVKHGIAVLPPAGHETQIRPRSSTLFKRKLHVAFGTIDASYRGELMSCVLNLGPEPVTLLPGERVSQLVVAPVAYAQVTPVATLPETVRGAGGYGSTGG